MPEHLLREVAPQVLGDLVRRHGRFDACEDAVQEALLAAARQWPGEGVPDNPRAWLLTVATRRLTDHIRSESARRRREEAQPVGETVPAADEEPGGDDTLLLLFLCCHPDLSPPSQLALTLRAVGGLSTAEIARAFLVPEPTIAQRISRAKRTVAGGFVAPVGAERLAVVLQVLYLIFNEGYTATSGSDLQRPELAVEAIRLTRAVHAARPDDGEVAGLLALMLLTDARREARTDGEGRLVPLAEQDRRRWDAVMIDEGVAVITDALARTPMGPYQVQAAIAAVHAEAADDDTTDWAQIAALYDVLGRIAPNPMVTLNHAVAVARCAGAEAGLAMLAPLHADRRTARHHRLHAVRGHLLELAGEPEAAREAYREAARLTSSLPERRYLEDRAAALPPPPGAR